MNNHFAPFVRLLPQFIKKLPLNINTLAREQSALPI